MVASRSRLFFVAAVGFALVACNLVVGGEDKVLVSADENEGGAAGTAGFVGGAGKGAGSVQGGSAGRGGAGAAGTFASGGTGGSPPAGAGGVAGQAPGGFAGGGAAGTSAGMAGSGGSAGTTPVYTGPGQIDCEAAPTAGVHRFCADFTPLPSGWESAGCHGMQVEGSNTLWRWEQAAGEICGTFVNVNLGSSHNAVTMAMWLRLDGLGLGDDKISVMHLRIGTATEGELAVRVDRDGLGQVTGTTLLVQTLDATPQVQVVGAFPSTDWRHVRLRVAANGQVQGSYGVTTADVIAQAEVATKAGPAAPPYVELPFRQTNAGTSQTKILLDDLIVDVQ